MRHTHVILNESKINFYEFFGVASDVTEEDLKDAYRLACLKYHPDKNGGMRVFEENFKVVQSVWSTLSNPASRARYDEAIGVRGRREKIVIDISEMCGNAWTTYTWGGGNYNNSSTTA